ncbi:hypothetical protein [Burkholderia ubonensis]|uniref:Uncharacterized protein n=1 Tax=Burkholderia ubonensis subsp. mesacidophila TaxID=265293 RepID=A0A2A4FLG0_9BURK|nr:hypothetical protein [Burkholderia ubonensis]PCE33464.1 hypothetical protein BZL54_04375 [Burkholderia ubonensis subsp. mesacidophila]
MNAPIDHRPCRREARKVRRARVKAMTSHALAGIRVPAPAEAAYTWQPVADGIYAIVWRSTVSGQAVAVSMP